MKPRPTLQRRSIALGGLLALMGVAAVTLTPAPAAAFVGVEVGPFALGLGPTEPPPPVVYNPPPVYTEPSVVYGSPSVTYYETYTPSYSTYYYPGRNVEVYGGR